MKPSFRVVLPLVGLMACVGDDPVAAPVVDAGGGEASVTDAGADAPSTAACDPNKDFGPPVLVEELNSSFAEVGLSISEERNVAVLARRLPPLTLLEGRRTASGTFGPLTPLNVEVDAGAADRDYPEVAISSDGLLLALGSSIRSYPPTDMLLATRPSVEAPFGPPEVIVSGTGLLEFGGNSPAFSRDGATLYFVAPSFAATSGGTKRPLMQAKRTGRVLAAPVEITEHDPGSFAISSDERVLYWSLGKGIRRAVRADTSARFGLGETVESLSFGTAPPDDAGPSRPTNILVAFVTNDDCSIYLIARSSDARREDIYVAKRPK